MKIAFNRVERNYIRLHKTRQWERDVVDRGKGRFVYNEQDKPYENPNSHFPHRSYGYRFELPAEFINNGINGLEWIYIVYIIISTAELCDMYTHTHTYTRTIKSALLIHSDAALLNSIEFTSTRVGSVLQLIISN